VSRGALQREVAHHGTGRETALVTGNTKTKLDARAETLKGLASGGDLDDAHEALALAAIRSRDAQPYLEELLDLATDAYVLTGASPDQPVELAGLAERYLPEYEYSGKVDHRNLRYALTYPALRAGGLNPDIWDDVVYWRSQVWPYAQQAVLAYLRIAAARTGTSVEDLAKLLQEP
jgi:hypothetical protein